MTMDLKAIKARLHSATGCAPDEDGTWRAERDITDEIGPFEIRTNERQFDDPFLPIAQVRGDDDDAADATFIANAPADVAALVAEVERLRDALWSACVTISAEDDSDPQTSFEQHMKEPYRKYGEPLRDYCSDCGAGFIGSHGCEGRPE